MIGALGIGRARDSVIGSVCERVARQSDRDVWVVKHVPEPGEPERDTILVGVDGSPQSFGALSDRNRPGTQFGEKVEAIAVYDPYCTTPSSTASSTSSPSRRRKFSLRGAESAPRGDHRHRLARYQSHVEIGERMGTEAGVAVKTLLDGKPFQKIIDQRARRSLAHRAGTDRRPQAEDETALGSNTGDILHAAPCDVLLSTRIEVPRLDVRAGETIRSTPEAEQRMTHVPSRSRGSPVPRPSPRAREGTFGDHERVIDEAMDRFMPKARRPRPRRWPRPWRWKGRSPPGVECRECGVTATQSGAVKCTVCGATDFEVILEEMIEEIAAVEGGLQEETTYDGRKLRWSEDARKGLSTMKTPIIAVE